MRERLAQRGRRVAAGAGGADGAQLRAQARRLPGGLLGRAEQQQQHAHAVVQQQLVALLLQAAWAAGRLGSGGRGRGGRGGRGGGRRLGGTLRELCAPLKVGEHEPAALLDGADVLERDGAAEEEGAVRREVQQRLG